MCINMTWMTMGGLFVGEKDIISMTTEHTETSGKEPQLDGAVAQIQCNCGNWLKTDTKYGRVTCECGERFAVTISSMGSASHTD
jgi:hypothetical protein